MLRRSRSIHVLGGAAVAAFLMLAVLTPADAKPPRPPKAEPRDARGRAADHLRHAYRTLGEVSRWQDADAEDDDDDSDRLRDLAQQARRFYRQAHEAYQDGEYHRAAEMALAANDAGRGLMHLSRADADTPDLSGLPAPPDADDPRAADELRRAADRLAEWSDTDVRDSRGGAFLAQARRVLREARREADEGDTQEAAELARAAEAWTHVPEHLMRADEDGPEPRGPRPPRP